MDGCFIINKPAGLTSHDVVAQVRKIAGERRVGHTGTLDPFATGVLVVLVGRATRLAQFLSGAEKEYEAVIRLGYATDTGDVTGQRIISPSPPAERGIGGEVGATLTPPPAPPRPRGGEHAISFGSKEIEGALASLRGEIEQTPPMYSAKKIAGQKLYELARRGEEVERKAIRVKVREFEAVARDGALLKPNNDGTSDLAVRVVCSAGTYIRALAEVFGKHLGLGAHLAELRRTRAGQFKIEDAITLDRLSEQAQSGSIESNKISPANAVSHLPAVELSAEDLSRTLHGIDTQIDKPESCDWSGGQSVRMLDMEGDLVAVGIYDDAGKSIHPAVVIANK